jgi:hypothetical protein
MSAPDFDFDEGIKSDNTSSGSSGSSGPSVPEWPENAVEFILDVLAQKGDFELPAFARNADAIPEKYAEHYGFDGEDTLSVQDLFDIDWDETDFVGTEPLVNNPEHPDVEDSAVSEEQLETLTEGEKTTQGGDPKKYILDPEYATQFRDARIDDSTVTSISRGVNGYHSETIAERFGDDTRFKATIGKKRNNDGDAAKQRKSVFFTISDSETAADKREEWAAEVADQDE